MNQTHLQDAILDCYMGSSSALSNSDLYSEVASLLNLGDESNEKSSVGKSGARHNLFHRKVRWAQQSLKKKGFISRVSEGSWDVTGKKRAELHAIKEAETVIAMSTELGVCLWSQCENAFKHHIREEIHLVLSSPPYPLKVARAYGNVVVDEYVEFIIRSLEPIVERMAKGASIALNISNDIFEEGSPARSIYQEELVLAMYKRLSLYKMDMIPWVSNKAPGPYQYASKDRTQLNTTWEPVYWFTNDPKNVFSDNRRVLQEHSDVHRKFMEKGGNQKHAIHGDGAYIKKKGAYSNITEGKIPKNVLNMSNYCHSGRQVNKYARRLDIPVHAAKMPLEMAKFYIEFLTEKGMTVADPFAGTLTVGQGAEELGRKWFCIEMMWEYIRQSFTRFEGASDFWINPHFVKALH